MKVCVENNGVCMVAENKMETQLLKEKRAEFQGLYLQLIKEFEKK